MTRVLYVEPIGANGGMGPYNAELVEAIIEGGADVTVVSSSPSATRAGSIVRFKAAMDRSASQAVRLLSYLAGWVAVLRRSRDCDVVVTHFAHVPPIDLFGVVVLRLLGKASVIVAHDPLRLGGGAITWSEILYLRSASRCVVHGPAAAQDLLLLGIRSDSIVVGSLPDYGPVPASDEERSLALLSMPNDGRSVFSIIGNLKPEKGAHRVVQAWGHGPNWPRLLVVGSVQGGHGIETIVGETDNPNVELRIGRLTEDEERAAYSLSTAVLAVYTRGYSSAVVARAHSLNRPVIATDVGDLPLQLRAEDVLMPRSWTADDLRDVVLGWPFNADSRTSKQQETSWIGLAELVVYGRRRASTEGSTSADAV